MVQTGKTYKCEICGNVVDVIEGKGLPISCCGQEMVEVKAKFTDNEGNEKHVPVIEKTEVGLLVKVGSIAHPMEEKHSILYIELVKDGRIIERVYLKPGDSPEAEFIIGEEEQEGLIARAYCNLHGLWVSE